MTTEIYQHDRTTRVLTRLKSAPVALVARPESPKKGGNIAATVDHGPRTLTGSHASKEHDMARTRAILTDPDRNLISAVLMNAQALQEETARILAFRVRKHVLQAEELREAQARLTASEARADRSAWNGTERRDLAASA